MAGAPHPSGRTNTAVAVVLVGVLAVVAGVAVFIPEVLDPVRARLGTLPPPRTAPELPDAGVPAAGPPPPARLRERADAGATLAPGDAGAGAAEDAPARPPPRRKRRPR
jgi:hypothetical protein